MGEGWGFDVLEGGLGVGVVADEGVEVGAALGLEDAGDGLGLGCVGAEAVDGFGLEGDEVAGLEEAGGFGDAGGVRVEEDGHARE